MQFKVFRTLTFDKDFNKLPKSEQEEIEKFEKKQLIENPFVGKPLGFIFLREKKLNNRRVYYLIYKEFVIVLMVAISDKKTQQATIENIKENLDAYYELIKEKLSKF